MVKLGKFPLAGLSAVLRDDSDCNSRVGADRARGLVEE
jgi:hypothetical protein